MRRGIREGTLGCGAISFIVVYNDLLDAHKSLLARPDFLGQLGKVSVHLAAALVNLVVEVAVARQHVGYDLVCDEILPVRAGGGGGAVAELQLGLAPMVPGRLQDMLDLHGFSGVSGAEQWCAYRMLAHFVHLGGRAGGDFRRGGI